MDLIEHISTILVQEEGRKARVAKKASVRPSEASAVLADKSESNIVGKCHREIFLRMIGTPAEETILPEKALQFRVGRAVEEDVGNLAGKAGVLVATGVRVFVPNLNTAIEMDDVFIDPDTNQGVIADCKTISGHYSNNKVLKQGKAKESAVMQELVYLNEFRTGKALKAAIMEAYEKRMALEGRRDWLLKQLEEGEGTLEEQASWRSEAHDLVWELKWNRVEVDWDNFNKMDDGPTTGMLVYVSRDEAGCRQFNVAIDVDPLDGHHLPKVDGASYSTFTVESIYERFNLMQSYYQRACDEAARLLELQGVTAPAEDAPYTEQKAYWDQMGREMRDLPMQFLPPAEYEWKYSPEKIEALHDKGLVLKTAYEEWKLVSSGRNRKPRPVPVIGAWQCRFCDYSKRCIGLQDPSYANLAQDLLEISDDAA